MESFRISDVYVNLAEEKILGTNSFFSHRPLKTSLLCLAAYSTVGKKPDQSKS